MAKCAFCGQRNPADVEICKGCGAKIPDRDRQSPPQQITSKEDDEPAASPTDDLESRVLEELQAGGKISAIKLYREQTGVGLKEAKDVVEALGKQHGIVAKPSGCAAVVLLMLAVCATLIAIS